MSCAIFGHFSSSPCSSQLTQGLVLVGVPSQPRREQTEPLGMEDRRTETRPPSWAPPMGFSSAHKAPAEVLLPVSLPLLEQGFTKSMVLVPLTLLHLLKRGKNVPSWALLC